MNKIVVFCVETKNNANTDNVYIKKSIEFYYPVSVRKNSVKFITMNSKTRYKNPKVKKQIQEYIHGNENNSVVVYCIDTDDYDVSPETNRYLESIQKYCEESSYRFVFFCRDIEDVYWEHQISDHDKVDKAKQFKMQEQIKQVSEKTLRYNSFAKHGSNLLNVMDQIFEK